MVIRKHGRYAAFWLVKLIHNGVEYQGTTRNVSLKGCAIKTPLPGFAGMQVRVHFMAPDQAEPLCIDKAFVRWRSQDVIGLEFSQIAQGHQDRLCRVIQDLEAASPKPSAVREEPPLISISLPKKVGEQQTVLVVDDEDAILGVCAVILERAGFRVLKAKDSAQALQICSAHSGPIDALITDLVLVPRGFRIASSDNRFPQVHGQELAMRALAIRPDLRIGFMSGNLDKDLAGYGIKRGAYPFLSKPFSMEELVQFVRDVLATEGTVTAA